MSKHDLLLWLSIFVGPIVWFWTMETNFALAPAVCHGNSKSAAYFVSAIGLVLTGGGAATAWTLWKRLGREFPGDWGGAVARSRFMAIGGTALAAASFLVILAQTIPQIILKGCE